MILYDAADIKVGSEQVVEVRAGTELVWPRATAGIIWTFGTPSGGEEIKLSPRFNGIVDIDWGDGDIDTLNSGVSINHVY
jgi:hypothetical protein